MIQCLAICTGVLLLSPMLSSANEEPEHLVGVATIFDDAGWHTQVEYFNELIGPALNMKFMYSDKLNNSMELTDFMTRAISMGCDGIINFVTQNDFDWAAAAAEKKKHLDCSKAEFLTIDEGLCVQIMHIGPFDDEPATVSMMNAYLLENGYENDFSGSRLHHEIYLSDARKVAPEKWKTVIRHPIKRKEA